MRSPRTNTNGMASLAFRPDLQGLRAIAILAVVVSHAGATLFSGGFVGVDIFFVLSGYLITGLLLCEHRQNGRIVLIRFYARRLKRLLPALVVMLIGTSIATVWLLSTSEAHAYLASAPFAAAWTSNIYLAFTRFGYFDELGTRDIFLHTWSLGVEEQFYLVWPLILLAFLFAQKRFPERPNGWIAILGIVFASSLAVSLYWTYTAPHAAFYLMPSRVWQFTLGALVYLLVEESPSREKGAGAKSHTIFGGVSSRIVLSVGLLLVTASVIGLHPELAYPGFWALAPSLGAALVIIAGHALPAERHGPLAHPALVWLGDRSYSWYLWHWPVLVLGFSLGFEGRPLPTAGLVLLSLLAAILSYRFVELPFWKGRFRQAQPRRILLLSVLAMTLTIAGSFHQLRLLPHSHPATRAVNQWRMDLPIIYKLGCDAWYQHARVEPCIFGRNDAAKTVVLLGDSIGAQWFSMVPAIFSGPEWRTIVLTKSSCAMVDEDYFYSRIKQTYQVCADWREGVLEMLDENKPDVIIMGNSVRYKFSSAQWVEGSQRIFERISKAAKHVLVIPGTPSLGFDGPGCLARHLSPEGHIDTDACIATARMQRAKTVIRYLEDAAQPFPNLHILDLNDLVCPGGVCDAAGPKTLAVFRDSKHLTDSFVKDQIPIAEERIRRILADHAP